jgi:exosortase E/protease (VPEID-CTERM system)
LLAVAALIGVESLLISALIQDVPRDALIGASLWVRLVQHWGFRYLIAYAVSFAMLIYLRGAAGVAAISATGRDSPLRLSWLAVHGAMFAAFARLTTLLYEPGLPLAAVAVGWTLLAAATALTLFASAAPARVWLDAWRKTAAVPAYALLPAAGALLAYKASQWLWAPAAAITFHVVQWLLHPLLPSLRSDAQSLTLISDHFAVTVSEECSGLEGIGLMLAFCAAWLWYFRREYIFPRALLIIPSAVLLIFVLNAVRIAALLLIGDAGHQRVASFGFHSQAGWIAFNLAAFCVAMVAKRSAWLNRAARDAAHATTYVADATPAYLMPLLAILASGMVAHAVSAGFDLLYPLRLFCGALALWIYRDAYRSMNWRSSWRGVLVGIGIFCLWMTFAHFLSVPAGEPADLVALPAPWREGWIACRALAAIVTVPIAEELAYRGYLMRRLVSGDFERLPLNAVSLLAVLISAVAFGSMHGRLWIAGIIAGLAYGAIAVKSGKIGESVVAHATTNALIAAQVLLFDQWQLW